MRRDEPVMVAAITSDTESRALKLYRLALLLVEAKGHSVKEGLMAYRAYRNGNLSIIHFPKTSHLNVWHRRKVLTVSQRGGSPKVAYYSCGEWEEELQEEAQHALKSK